MRLSIRSKIILALLPLGLACLALGGLIGYRAGDRALSASVERELTAQREMKRERVEAYIQTQLRYTTAAATSRSVAEASQAFIAALREMREAAIDPVAAGSDNGVLQTWYREQFVPRLEKMTGSHIEAGGLAAPRSRLKTPAGRLYRPQSEQGRRKRQAHGVAARRRLRQSARSSSIPASSISADIFGLYDINLVDPVTGDVFYTVAKETDFLSNINHNPLGRSGFAEIVERALDPRNGGAAVMQDYTPYPPSGFAPQLFAAMPVTADGQTVAVLVAQIDAEGLDRLLTDNGKWRENGAGRLRRSGTGRRRTI